MTKTTTIRAWARRVRSAARRARRSRPPASASRNASGSVSSKPPAKPNGSAATESEPTGYAAYGEFVKDELAAEDARKASFEQRGQTVITTGGTLVTLLFALAALSTRESTTFDLPDGARVCLFIGLVLFLASTVAALVVNAPRTYQVVPVDKIRERLNRTAPPTADRAAKAIALSRLDALASAKAENAHKGRVLARALLLEGLAVGFVAAAVVQIL